MAFNSPSDPTLPALTQDRIKGLFDREQWKYFLDSDGDLGGIWDNNFFYFMLRGEQQEILFTQGRLNTSIPIERLEEVRAFLNDWNTKKLWPKAYHRIGEDGSINIFADHVSDWEDGITDDQLFQTLNCALATSHELFETIKTELSL